MVYLYIQPVRNQMSPKQKILSSSAALTLVGSIVALIFTLGLIPYKASEIDQRVKVCEGKFDKIDSVVEDVAYIRGWVDSQGGTK